MEQLHIFKIGGGILENPTHLHSFLKNFVSFKNNKVLIHGGGRDLDKLLLKLNIKPNKVNGRRITDDDTIDVVVMLYAGLMNKKIVATLHHLGQQAIGLSGADANVILANKRPVNEIDYGWVGDIVNENIRHEWIQLLFEQHILPVFCSITHDGKGNLLNTNADTIASQIAIAMSPTYEVTLHFCFDKLGVLTNPNNENSYIDKITFDNYKKLKQKKIISDGMIPKLDNAFHCLNQGVKKIVIEHALNINNHEKTTLSLT